MTTALLCPTRARPLQLKRMISSVRATSDGVNIYTGTTFGVDERGFMEFPDGMPTVYKWNILAEEAMKDPGNKLFMLCADDVVFSTPLWDKALLEAYNNLEEKTHVFALQDSRDKDGFPHPIFTREWIEFFGYMLPPIFLHWRIDTWSVELAKNAGCFTHLKDYMLGHIKPSDYGNPDETHSRIRDWGWHNRDQYVNEKCQHYFELDKKRLKEKIVSDMTFMRAV